MNEYEISKLKKELQRKNENLKQAQEENKFISQQLVQAQAEKEKFYEEIQIARQTIDNVDLIIAERIREVKVKFAEENSGSLSQLQTLKERVLEEQHLNEKLVEENRNKDAVISQLSHRLRELYHKHKDPSMIINTKQLSQQITITHNQFYKLTEKYNRLSADMENIMAQNKILRKLHGVPQNFGFDLEEIKIAEKQELEDYKAQCRKLQTEIEELEAERTQLRYRLRQYNTLYSNKGERYKDLTQRQLQLLDIYALNLKEGKVELPEIDKSQKQMEKEIIRLRAQVEVLQNRGQVSMFSSKGGNQGNQTGEQLNKDDLRKLQEQIRLTLEPLVKDMKSLSENNINSLIQNFQTINNNQVNKESSQYIVNPGSNVSPPIPLPLANNNWSKIKQGYSYKYSSKIPIDMKDLEGDINYDQLKARYQIAALQLQNIQSLKMLKQKQDHEKLIKNELFALQEKYKKCLHLQDDLFLRFFKEKDKFKEGIKSIQLEKRSIRDERDELRAEVSTLREAFNALNAKTDLEDKFKNFSERLAKSEPGMVKAERKYEIIYEQHLTLRDCYTKLEQKAAQNEFLLKQKLLTAKKNEKMLVLLTNQVLDETKDSISSDTHSILLSKMEILNDKAASSAFKQAELRVKISRLESVERQMNIKDDMIEYLREDKLDLSLELEILRNRLEAIDPDYRTYRIVFDRLIKFMNENSISILSYFKKFDRDNSGNLDKPEFLSALRTLGFKINNDEFEALYSEFDLDGSGTVNYKQFMRKLKRSGVISRSDEEQAIYSFFKAIKQAGISIKKAFQIIDMDGSNKVSKSEMETAFRKIGIDCNAKAVDAIFRITDSDLDGSISCKELETLYHEVIRDSEIDEIQFKPELDWKFKFVLKIQQSAIHNGMTLQDTFSKIDNDNNSYMTMSELSGFLSKAGVYLEKRHLDELFKFLDTKYDGKVEYGEFLRALEEAKKQQKRIDRLQAVQNRAQQLRKQNQLENARKVEIQKNAEEAGLKVRMMALQTKQGNLIKKNEKLCKNLANKEQQIKDSQRTLQENERALLKVQDEYYKEKESNIILREKMKNYIGETQSKKIKDQSIKVTQQLYEASTELDKYKQLYVSLTDKNKAELLSVEKIKAELQKHYDIVKDLQSQSTMKQDLGNLALELENSKRNEEIVNHKYEDMTEELRKLNQENRNLSVETVERDKQIVNVHLMMKEKSNLMQKNIDSLTAKILPTVSISKIDQFILKLRTISNSKSNLEEQNKSLREKNFNLQIRNDYIENQKVHLDELEKRLRRNYTDDNSVTVIDLTKKLSDYKMGELKAKRELNLVKEKEEYYTRINDANTDNIKDLEEQLGKWEVKFNDREEFWRKRLSDQLKLLQEIQKESQKAKQNEAKAVAYFSEKKIETEKIEQTFNNMDEKRSKNLQQSISRPISVSKVGGSGPNDNEEYLRKIDELSAQLNRKQKQIYNLKSTLHELVPEEKLKFSHIGSQIGHYQNNSFIMQTDLTSSSLKNNARRFINNQKDQEVFFREEAEKMAQAAQQSIDTLQRIIDDKNEQLKRKDHTLSDLKREMLKSKEEDCFEIQKLHEEIRELRSKREMANLNEIMNKSTHKNFYPSSTEAKIQSLMEVINEKDEQLKKMENKYNQLYIKKSKVKSLPDNNYAFESKIKQLEDEREKEKSKLVQSESKLKEKVKNLQKLTKQKDLKLTQLHKALVQIKEDVMNEKYVAEHEKVEGNQDLIERMNRGSNANDGRMQAMLQKAKQTIQIMTKKNKEYEAEIKKLREENRMGKTFQRR